MTGTPFTEVAKQLERQFGLDAITLHYGLNQDELFRAAVDHDRGRVHIDGPDDDHKAFATALGVDGPLLFYSDPACTGRPVNDTFAVARPEVVDTVWWKDGFAQFDPAAFDRLLTRVVTHLNERRAELYVTDVFCGWDPDFTEAYQAMITSYSALEQRSYVAYARGMEAFSFKDFETAKDHLESAINDLPYFAPVALG
ncbi:MAG: phosphoenolpyruvate carboxykinase (ATP), partial [Acidimicrobiales bacterium]